MSIVKLPSGAELSIQVATFAESKALYQAILKELKGQKISASDEVDVNFLKDLVCSGLSSKEIDLAMEPCLKRCLYKGSKILPDESFEEEDSRQDYFMVLFHVAKANIEPFLKPLFADLKALLPKILESLPVK